jgi:hypothetical protein
MPRSWRGLGSAASRRPLTVCSLSATGGISPGVPGSHCGRSRTWRAALNAGFLAHNIFPRALREGWRNILPLTLREAAWGEAASLGGCVHPAPSSSRYADTHGGCSARSGEYPRFGRACHVARASFENRPSGGAIGSHGTVTHHTRIAYPVAQYNARKNSAGTNSVSCSNVYKQPQRPNNPREQTTPGPGFSLEKAAAAVPIHCQSTCVQLTYCHSACCSLTVP